MTEQAPTRGDLAGTWRHFSETECKGYSPLYEEITRACAEDPDVMDFLLSLPMHASQPNLLLAAMHDRVIQGLESTLAPFYSGASTRDVGRIFVNSVLAERETLGPVLSSRFTQTNEIGRVATLAPALSAIPECEDLTLIDVGTSAGLTLRLDECFIDFGSYGSLGPRDSKVRVEAKVLSGHPPLRRVPIRRRVGLDRNILDPSDPDDARWLLACVWPDTGRFERTCDALELAANHPIELIQGDALETLPLLLSSIRGPVVITTTWVVAYMDKEDRALFSANLRTASQERDIYWISAEAPGVVSHLPEVDPPPVDGPLPSVVGLVTFTKDEIADARVLAHVHSHGSWIWWYDQ
jgi:hypothetical protein